MSPAWRWTIIGLLMVVAGGAVYLGGVLQLAKLGLDLWGNKDALLYPDHSRQPQTWTEKVPLTRR